MPVAGAKKMCRSLVVDSVRVDDGEPLASSKETWTARARAGRILWVFVVVAAVMLAVSVSIVVMPAAARETLTGLVDRVHGQASAAGAPTVFLRLFAQPGRFVSGLRVVGALYAVAAGALLLYALT